MKGIKLWGQCRTVGSKQIVIPSKLREMKILFKRDFALVCLGW